MLNAGDGDGVNGQQRDNAAANVREHPEGLYVGDAGVYHVAGGEAANEFLPALFLGGPPGEQGGNPAVFVPGKVLHQKAHRPVHPGEDGDVPHGAVLNAQGPFLPGDEPPHEFQVHNQVVLGVAHHGLGLQDFPIPHSLRQGGGGLEGGPVFKGVYQMAFWMKLHFPFFLSLQGRTPLPNGPSC